MGYVARMEGGKYVKGFWSENLKARDYLEGLTVDGR
jgi:hypothetical protein